MPNVQINRRSLGSIPEGEIPIANPSDHSWTRELFLMWAGAYGDNKVYIWANSFDDAWEAMVDFFDEKGDCGVFTFFTENDYRAVAEELGIEWPLESKIDELSEREIARIEQKAEVDMTIVGHTRLSCMPEDAWQAAIPSWEWGGSEVHRGADYDLVKAASEAADED